MIIIIVVTDTV